VGTLSVACDNAGTPPPTLTDGAPTYRVFAL